MVVEENIWNNIFEGLRTIDPKVYESIVHYYPISKAELAIRTREEDGKDYIYNWVTRNLRPFVRRSSEPVRFTEFEWLGYFSRKLCELMRINNISRYDLSALTKISEVSISKYLNGKSTPSTFNLIRIAQALNCTVSELTYFEELERNYDHA